MAKEKRISPEDEQEIDVCVGVMQTWVKNCPGRCPFSNLFKIIVNLQDDRTILKHLLEIKKERFY